MGELCSTQLWPSQILLSQAGRDSQHLLDSTWDRYDHFRARFLPEVSRSNSCIQRQKDVFAIDRSTPPVNAAVWSWIGPGSFGSFLGSFLKRDIFSRLAPRKFCSRLHPSKTVDGHGSIFQTFQSSDIAAWTDLPFSRNKHGREFCSSFLEAWCQGTY